MIWTTQQRKYQLWLAVPPDKRPKDLKTREQVAKRLKVGLSTLDLWESLPGWWTGVHAFGIGIVGRALPSILTSLVRRAEQGHTPSIKLALQTLNLLTERTEADITHHHADQLMVVVSARQSSPEALPSGESPRLLPNQDDDENDESNQNQEPISDWLYVRSDAAETNQNDAAETNQNGEND